MLKAIVDCSLIGLFVGTVFGALAYFLDWISDEKAKWILYNTAPDSLRDKMFPGDTVKKGTP